MNTDYSFKVHSRMDSRMDKQFNTLVMDPSSMMENGEWELDMEKENFIILRILQSQIISNTKEIWSTTSFMEWEDYTI